MRISSDEWVFWTFGSYELSATIIFTWMIMLLLVVTSILVTRRLSDKDDIPLFQNFLEVLVSGLFGQIQGVLRRSEEHTSELQSH